MDSGVTSCAPERPARLWWSPDTTTTGFVPSRCSKSLDADYYSYLALVSYSARDCSDTDFQDGGKEVFELRIGRHYHDNAAVS